MFAGISAADSIVQNRHTNLALFRLMADKKENEKLRGMRENFID